MEKTIKKFYHYICNIVRKILFYLYINIRNKKTVFLLGTPSHNNIGDSAIVVAELLFLKNEFGFKVKEVTTNEYRTYKKLLFSATKDRPVFLHGGGNMGDLWYGEEELRRDTLSFLKPYRFIIFPQTLFYSNTTDGEKKKNDSISYYSNRKITIFAREMVSYNQMKVLYPCAEIVMVPDIVLYLKGKLFLQNEMTIKDYLVVFRSDIEKVDGEYNKAVIDYLEKGNSFSITDMQSEDIGINKGNRIKVVKIKLEEFSKYKAIITDRLHGMIFAYLLNKPCLVFDINNHKISETYKLLSTESIIMHNFGTLISKEIKELLNPRDNLNNAIIDYSEMIRIIKKYADH